MKIKRKIIFFIALMSLFYCLTLMQDTYAKYVSTASANADLTIARWNILINNQDILNNSDFSDSITPVFNGTTTIKSDVIAPTAEGYFDIVINGEDTDVSFEYTISLDQAHDNTVDDLVITKYVINNEEHAYTDQDITGDILFNDSTKTKSIRFYVLWDDDEATQTMDNEEDTLSAQNGVAAFIVNVNVIQKREAVTPTPDPDPTPEP